MKKVKLCFILSLLIFAFLLIDIRTRSISHRHYDRRFIGRVFIALNLYQSEALLSDGSWMRTMLELIERLGEENVYLSIFENDSTDSTSELLKNFSRQLSCEHRIITGEYSHRRRRRPMSRIDYLAKIRNYALEPLNNQSEHFSKLLFLNDVIFTSDDVLRLLQTNQGDYAATCALDFINPIKFYDTFATRDHHGYSMGLPIYPFFAPGSSRDQILRGDRLIHVKSCWSGMVAFDIRPFERGLRFRSLFNETEYDASECCLIHADIDQPNRTYINRDVRVAYSSNVYYWQKYFASIEFLWSYLQQLISFVARLPRYNKHRLTSHGGFCWINEKLILKKPL